MKIKFYLFVLLLMLTISPLFAKVKVEMFFNNYFEKPVNIEIRSGGKFGGGGISDINIATATLGAKSNNVKIAFKAKKRDFYSVVGRFPDGSSFLFYQFSIPADGSSISAIDIKPENSQKLKSNQEFLKDLENSFYNPSLVSNLIYKVEGNSDDAFKQLFGALAIVKKEGAKYVEVDRIRPEVLKNNEQPKFVKDRSKNFDYTFSSEFLTTNKGSVPGVSDIDFSFNTNNSYKFNYTAVGFGKVLHNDPEGKSIEDRFNVLSEQTKNSFLATLALDTINKYEVRVYNEAFAYKGMYLKIEEFTKSSFNDKINASTFFNNEGGYTRSTRQSYEEIFGQTVISVGFNGENKTAYFKKLAKDYLEKLNTKLVLNTISLEETEKIINEHQVIKIDLKSKNDAKLFLDKYINKLKEE